MRPARQRGSCRSDAPPVRHARHPLTRACVARATGGACGLVRGVTACVIAVAAVCCAPTAVAMWDARVVQRARHARPQAPAEPESARLPRQASHTEHMQCSLWRPRQTRVRRGDSAVPTARSQAGHVHAGSGSQGCSRPLWSGCCAMATPTPPTPAPPRSSCPPPCSRPRLMYVAASALRCTTRPERLGMPLRSWHACVERWGRQAVAQARSRRSSRRHMHTLLRRQRHAARCRRPPSPRTTASSLAT